MLLSQLFMHFQTPKYMIFLHCMLLYTRFGIMYF